MNNNGTIMEKKLCIICLDTCKTKLNLQLNCECNYVVHYKCFNKWWKKNKNCIICKELCKKQKKGQKYIKFKEKDMIIKKIIENRFHRRNNYLIQTTTHNVEELREQLFEIYHSDNNERINMIVCSKILQIFFYLLLGLIIWILYTTV